MQGVVRFSPLGGHSRCSDLCKRRNPIPNHALEEEKKEKEIKRKWRESGIEWSGMRWNEKTRIGLNMSGGGGGGDNKSG